MSYPGAGGWIDIFVRNQKSREFPIDIIPGSLVTNTVFESLIPMIVAGIAKISPISGPAAPTSISPFLSGMGDFIFITAPNVPSRKGAGIKKGRVAFIPSLLQAK